MVKGDMDGVTRAHTKQDDCPDGVPERLLSSLSPALRDGSGRRVRQKAGGRGRNYLSILFLKQRGEREFEEQVGGLSLCSKPTTRLCHPAGQTVKAGDRQPLGTSMCVQDQLLVDNGNVSSSRKGLCTQLCRTSHV